MRKSYLIIILLSLFLVYKLPTAQAFSVIREDRMNTDTHATWYDTDDSGVWCLQGHTGSYIKEGNGSVQFRAELAGNRGWGHWVDFTDLTTFDWNLYFWIYISELAESGSYTGTR